MIVRGGAVAGVVVRCLVSSVVPGSSGVVGSESSGGDVDGRGYSRLVERSVTLKPGSRKDDGYIEALIVRVSIQNRCPPRTFPTLWMVHRRTLCHRDLEESSRLSGGHRVKWGVRTV